LVGQFENQKLLSDTYQLRLLDQFGGTTQLAESFRQKLVEYRATLDEKSTLERSQNERAQRLDYLDYQINEINQLDPKDDEEEELIQLKSNFLNQERKQMLLLQLEELIDGGDSAVGLTSISRTGRSLIAKNQNLISSGFFEKFAALEVLIDDIKSELRNMNIRELNEDELQDVIDRLDSYQKLKRKFGGSVSSIIASRDQFMIEAEGLRTADISLSEITKRISSQESALSSMAEQLHNKRLNSALEFSHLLTSAVRELKMIGAEIKLNLERTNDLTDQGFSKLNFLAQTNPGEGFYKVKEIASGGELSRILLALRKVLATHDSISIFLFDEIDTGMGGETALHIGKSLKKVSEASQVVTITHLPQIASFADKLILVSKETTEENSSDRTESRVKEIESIKDIKKAIESMVPLH
jgi:DNA repair protein RecN (Recombination protein N)